MPHNPAPTSVGAGLCFMPMTRIMLVLLLCCAAGCAKVNREQLEQEILAADPEFSGVLDKRRELANRLQTYERELALKRTSIERNISQLRGELADVSENVKTKTAEIRKRMEPDHERISLALSLANEKLRVARTQRASVSRSATRLRKALKASGQSWSNSEFDGKRAELQELERDAARLDHELQTLKRHVRLLRSKLLLLKL